MPPVLNDEILPQPASIAAAVRNPGWIAHRYDPGYDAIHFLPVPRVVRTRITFLTNEYLPQDREPLVIRRQDAVAAAPAAAPIHFVFHSAYCCSTMVARAFDRPGWATVLKEPLILNDLVGWRRRGGPGNNIANVLDDVLTLLARPFERGEAVIVKPSNIINSIAAAMLTLRGDSRALLLHAPLRIYLGSIAKKGIDGRLWVRKLLTGLLDDHLIDLGFSARDLLEQSDLQVAAVGWIAQNALFVSLINRFGANRIRTLDSEALTADPAKSMMQLAALFGLPMDDDTLRDIVTGPAFTRHSKHDASFASADRAAEHHDAAQVHADEIEKVVIWAEMVAHRAGVPLVLPAGLIEGLPA